LIPIGSVKPSGDTEMKLIVGAVTVIVVVCLTPPALAEIVTEPALMP
jgi:hypothetical protein